MLFDTYEINKEGRLVKLASLKNKNLGFFYRLKKGYKSEDFEQIATVSTDIVCMVTKDHIDFWNQNENHFELLWSCQYRTHKVR